MKRLSVFSYAMVMIATACAAPGIVEIDLVTARIEVADLKHPTHRLAAEELEKHLLLIAGERRPAKDGFAFMIGSKAPGGKDAPEWTSLAELTSNAVYFWGDDGKPEKGKKRIKARHGSLFAMYGFLEKVLGVKWVRSGDDGIIYKNMKAVKVPSDWNYSFFPPLELSNFRAKARTFAWKEKWEKATPGPLRISSETAVRRSEDDALWILRHRHQTRDKFSYGHAFVHWNPKYIHTHPEFLALDAEGVRGNPKGPKYDGERVQLCLSNPAAQDRIIDDWLAGGTNRYLNVCPNDSKRHCRCAECRKWDADAEGESFDATKSDRYVKFWNTMIAKARRYRPDVQLVTYIYANWRHPPRRERIEYPDNFVGGIVPSIYEDSTPLIDAWIKRGMKRYFVRPNYLCYGCAMPRGLERFLFEDFKLNFKQGMMGIDEDNWKRGRLMDFERYVLARAIAEPDLDFDDVEREFLSQFGAAAPEMGEYYRRVRERGEAARLVIVKRTGGRKIKALDDSLLSGSAFEGHTEADLDGDLAVIAKALAKDGLSAAERKRVDGMRLVVEHAKLALRFVTFSTAGHSDAEFRKAGEELLAFRLKHNEEMAECWGALFRTFPVEVRLWMRMNIKRIFPEITDP